MKPNGRHNNHPLNPAPKTQAIGQTYEHRISWHPRSSCEKLLIYFLFHIILNLFPILITFHSTGATGYIGGDILYTITRAYPDYEYAALVRGSKGAIVAAAYPKIRIVDGTLDDAAIIEEESAKADIVIGTKPQISMANLNPSLIYFTDTADSADHAGSATAIAKGLASGHTKDKPAHWLHLSGTGILMWKDIETKTLGEPNSLPVYNDLEGVSQLTSLPDSAIHRDVDKIVLAASSDSVKTAVITPPTIYGRGRGPGNQRSLQVYDLAAKTLKEGQAPVVGRGLTEWDNVHVHDLSNLYVLFLGAIAANDNAQDKELWGANGYFLAENGHHVWGEVSKQVAEAAFDQGYIKTKELKVVSASQIQGLEFSWGQNSRGEAKRARKYLGWKPTKKLEDEIPHIVTSEAALLGLKPGNLS